MAFDFPNSPTVGQTFQGYTWDGEKWVSTASGPNIGGVIRTVVFTASGAYVPSANMTTAVVEVRGSGGGGGGINQGTASQGAAGAGGGQGSISRSVLTAAQIGVSQPITIGNAGNGGATGNNVGTAGQDCSFGTLVIGKGGSGGGSSDPALVTGVAGAGGVVGTGDFSEPGIAGGSGQIATINTVQLLGGFGGGAGGGAAGFPNSNGANATGYGAGGAGGVRTSSTPGTQAGGNGSKGYASITEYGITSLSASTIAQGAVRFDLPQGLTTTQQKQARDNIAAVLHGFLFGLTLSTAGASTTFSVAPGVAADSTASYKMTLAAAISKTTAAWAVGTAVGALDTGTIAASTWYHAYLIQRPDTGVVDVLISLSATAPTLPANYTAFRRIGSMLTNASSQWTLFRQLGDEFLWDTTFLISSNVAISDALAHTLGLAVPPGIQTWALITGQSAGNVDARMYFSSLDKADEPAGGGNVNSGIYSSASVTALGVFSLSVRTNTSQQIRYRGAAGMSFYLNVAGWIDRRGRDA